MGLYKALLVTCFIISCIPLKSQNLDISLRTNSLAKTRNNIIGDIGNDPITSDKARAYSVFFGGVVELKKVNGRLYKIAFDVVILNIESDELFTFENGTKIIERRKTHQQYEVITLGIGKYNKIKNLAFNYGYQIPILFNDKSVHSSQIENITSAGSTLSKYTSSNKGDIWIGSGVFFNIQYKFYNNLSLGIEFEKIFNFTFNNGTQEDLNEVFDINGDLILSSSSIHKHNHRGIITTSFPKILLIYSFT